MNNIQLLEKRVEEGSISIVQAVGVPRSMSTAFCRAINEGPEPSVYVNEPFNRNNHDLEDAASSILSAAGDIEAPLVIVKNMASYLGADGFRWLEKLSQGTIWNVRHPLRQMGSLLTRIVNDQEQGSGDDTIPQEEIYDYLDAAAEFLLNSPKSTDFSKTGWMSLSQLFSTELQSPRIIVDGEDFVEDPKTVLTGVCDTMGMVYGDTMIQGWETPFVNVVNSGNDQETARSAWTADAWNSQGVKAVKRPSLDLDRVPESIRNHILKVALPVYQSGY